MHLTRASGKKILYTEKVNQSPSEDEQHLTYVSGQKLLEVEKVK